MFTTQLIALFSVLSLTSARPFCKAKSGQNATIESTSLHSTPLNTTSFNSTSFNATLCNSTLANSTLYNSTSYNLTGAYCRYNATSSVIPEEAYTSAVTTSSTVDAAVAYATAPTEDVTSTSTSSYTPAETSSTSTTSSVPVETSSTAPASGSFSGTATYYAAGLGACGWTNSGSDYIVAMNAAQYSGAVCGKNIKITDTVTGNTATAQIADLCPGCSYGDLDMSEGLFSALHNGNMDAGVFSIKWDFA